MGSGSTIKGILLMTALGTSATSILLPYQLNPFDLTQSIPSYETINIDQDDRFSMIDQKVQVDTIINFSLNLIKNSKNINSEYVDIVNENFWDLI